MLTFSSYARLCLGYSQRVNKIVSLCLADSLCLTDVLSAFSEQ